MRALEILNDRMVRWQYQAKNGGSQKKRQKALCKIKEIERSMALLKAKA